MTVLGNVYSATFVVEDPRYPMLVLEINGEPVGGYYLDTDTMRFDNPVCVCSAHDAKECICGVWDDK